MKSCPRCGYTPASEKDSVFVAIAEQRRKVLLADSWTIRARLTRREEAAISLVFQGMTNPAIAAELRTTEQCVKNALRFAFRKLGVKTRAGLIDKALREGGLALWLYQGEKYEQPKFETAAERHAAEKKLRGR